MNLRSLIRIPILLLLFAGAGYGQSACSFNITPGCPNTQTITVSGAAGAILVDGNAGLSLTFNYVIAGSPTISSIVVVGCGDPACTVTSAALDTYSSSTSTTRQFTLTAPYYKYKVTATFSGGTAPSITVNSIQTTAALSGGSGSGTVTSIKLQNNGVDFGSPITTTGTLNFVGCTVSASFTITCSGSLPTGTTTQNWPYISAGTNTYSTATGATFSAGVLSTIKPASYLTNYCQDATGACSGAAASTSGSTSIAASTTTRVVSTTKVTANSQIFVFEDSSLGSVLGVTCNTSYVRTYVITARTAGTSFTITSSAQPLSNPACISYWVVN